MGKVRIGTGSHAYDWIDHWAVYPPGDNVAEGWVHPGMAYGHDGNLYTSHPGRSDVLVYDRDGHLLSSFAVDVVEIHNLLIADDGGSDVLWIADNGARRLKAIAYEYDRSASQDSGQVIKVSLDGTELLRLPMPECPEYQDARWSPTGVAVDEERFGGNGDVWVADGYGRSLVHRFDKAGRHLSTLTGETGAGRFNCPHGIFIDRRGSDPRLLIADRANSRVQVYDLAGNYVFAFGQDFLKKPSCFTAQGGDLVIGDLSARLTVVDTDGHLVCHLGDNPRVCGEPGWPNSLDPNGIRVRSRNLEPGKFNSPHGLAADAGGDLYIAEWGIGGRLIKLIRQAT